MRMIERPADIAGALRDLDSLSPAARNTGTKPKI
jgi:hypothetical protein